MRNAFGVILAAALVTWLAVPAFALQDNWLMGLRPAWPGLQAMGDITIGTQVGALDGLDSDQCLWDSQYPPFPLSGMIELDIIGNQLPADGRWQWDIRAPYSPYSSFEIWNLEAYVIGGTRPTTTFTLNGWIQQPDEPVDYEGGRICIFDGNLTPWQCKDHSLASAITSFRLSPDMYGDVESPSFSIGPFTLSSPTDVRYFTVAVFYGPEPSSMLAMLSGLIGLAGFGLRRRRYSVG